jgi:hypothetical protein
MEPFVAKRVCPMPRRPVLPLGCRWALAVLSVAVTMYEAGPPADWSLAGKGPLSHAADLDRMSTPASCTVTLDTSATCPPSC